MLFKNDNIGLLIGTFIGSALGSIGTVLTLKKLNKLEYEKDKAAEEKRIQEICDYYEEKIAGIKIIKKSIELAPAKAKAEDKIVPSNITTNPKFIYQDNLAQQENDSSEDYDPADYNEGHAVLEVDRGVRPAVDYSKISRVYEGLTKEYERDENKDEIQFPHVISKLNYDRDSGYTKVELMYYEQNGIFATLTDDIVDEYTEDYFGLDNLGMFGSEQADPTGDVGDDEIYLRDKTLLIDFHIILNNTEDFNQVIGGR